ncbi:Fic family protein [Streptomyces sp. NPDC047085]|uniref:Fic family protein n=1 Tax=Streptomyces sp. NPDC047085 TaxID=3155140 RepID=UPI0033CB4F79
MTTDALAQWCRIREQVDWTGAVAARPHGTGPVQPYVDGLLAWYDGPVRHRDPERADRLLAALARTRADAARRAPLTPALLAGWQSLVLGTAEVPFRQGDAFAKRGRERYGLTPRTWRDFATCLRQATEAPLPLPSRAARVYLDVAFFHPFPDGNARLSLLALGHVLEREGVRLDEVGPLRTTRYADDAEGAADLAALVAVLLRDTRRRAPATVEGLTRAGPPWPGG